MSASSHPHVQNNLDELGRRRNPSGQEDSEPRGWWESQLCLWLYHRADETEDVWHLDKRWNPFSFLLPKHGSDQKGWIRVTRRSKPKDSDVGNQNCLKKMKGKEFGEIHLLHLGTCTSDTGPA